MIHSSFFFQCLKEYNVSIFAGVPDSLLKSFCAYLEECAKPEEYIITANEGNAIALVTGYHLSTGKIGAVFMQNSGLGNAVNPLTSLTDPEVYSIPLLLIIGWRGEPGKKDEPQHIKQGRITPALLDILGIPYKILDADSDLNLILKDLFKVMETIQSPVAILIREGTFADYKKKAQFCQKEMLMREEVLRKILSLIKPKDLLISTTGKTSRELFELRSERGEIQCDFLTVGSMGHVSSIALGVALGNPKRRVICLDGDGSILMHLGALPIIGSVKPHHFVHILFNNGTHESVGEQPTVADQIDFSAIAKGCGYEEYILVKDMTSLISGMEKIDETSGLILVEIKIRAGSRTNLGRPTCSLVQNKRAFMEKARD